eukprot:1662291-Pleurochrysis_carterae.AAC.1
MCRVCTRRAFTEVRVRLATTVSSAVLNRDAQLKVRDAAVKERDKQLLAQKAEAKQLKIRADEAQQREAEQQQRAAKLEDEIASKSELLTRIEANAKGAFEAQEAEHKIAIDLASNRLQQLINQLAEKALSTKRPQYSNPLPRGHSDDAFAQLSEAGQRSARCRDIEYATWFVQQRSWRVEGWVTVLKQQGWLEAFWESRELFGRCACIGRTSFSQNVALCSGR